MTKLPRPSTPVPRPAMQPQPQAAARRALYRERDFGVGYGNSSGYAASRRYAREWAGQPRFRCG